MLEAHEQFGGQQRPEWQMDGFRDAVQACGFMDLGFIGLPYTWDNRQQATNNVKVRLDGGRATPSFLSLFKNVKVWHVQTTESDHCCLVLECSKNFARRRRGRRPFRYENMWHRDPTYSQNVELPWNNIEGSGSLGVLSSQLGSLGRTLADWNQSTFGFGWKSLVQLRVELEQLREQSIGSGPTRNERWVMAEISELLSREETMERQRSWVQWLCEGDRNTSFFQAKSRERAKTNHIISLKNSDGSVVMD